MKDLIKKLEKIEHVDRMERMELFAQILKKQRKKYKLTLTKACEGICSVSYLSKIENNLLDNIEDGYILKLCDRMNIDYNQISTHNDNCNLEYLALDYLKGDYEKINIYFNQVNDLVDNVKSDIVKGYYYLINDEEDLLKERLGIIYEVASTMTATEYFMFICLVIEYLIKTFRMNKALEIYEELYEIGCRFKYINWLLELQGLNIYFHTNDYMNFLKHYYHIMNTDNLLFPYEIQVVAKMMKISLEIKHGKTYCVDENFLNQCLNNEYYNDILSYLKVVILYNLNNYQLVIDEIDNKCLLGFKYEVLYNLCKLNLGNYVVKDVFENFKNYHLIFNDFITEEYLVKESHLSGKECLSILKKYRRFEDDFQHHLYNQHIFNTLSEIYISTTYYKEAMNYLKKYLKKVI